MTYFEILWPSSGIDLYHEQNTRLGSKMPDIQKPLKIYKNYLIIILDVYPLPLSEEREKERLALFELNVILLRILKY